MFEELGRRASGRRESGAFLLSPRRGDGRTVSRLAYYDDLDPGSLRGGIRVAATAFARLWDLCDVQATRVVGDVHTHPGSHVRQSSLDRANPMVARRGHVALIVPDLAARVVRAREVGVHVYDGVADWEASYGVDAGRRIYIGRFA